MTDFLLAGQRFVPLFWAQFTSAASDNFFRFVAVILYAGALPKDASWLFELGAWAFLAPFILFSPIAGCLADKVEKSWLIQRLQLLVIPIAILGSLGILTENAYLFPLVMFLYGSQSTFFGPLKYSILPQHLPEHQLLLANGLVVLSTFLAILLGKSLAMVFGPLEPSISCGLLLALAVLGYWAARNIPRGEPSAPDLQIGDWFKTPFVDFARLLMRNRTLRMSILGSSWFWFWGAMLLSHLHETWGIGSSIYSQSIIFAFATGICCGVILGNILARGDIELGLTPLGSLGVSIFMIDLYFFGLDSPVDHSFVNVRAGIDFAMMGLFGSLYIVPLYGLLQTRARGSERSRVFAANNLLNGLFILASMALFKISPFRGDSLFLILAILNGLVTLYLFTYIPEMIMRFFIWVLASTIYNLQYENREWIPRQGAAVIVANHISFIDWFVITAASNRPVVFVMDHNIFKIPVLATVFRIANAIPIAPAKEDPGAKERAFLAIKKTLADGELLCIFPEGVITRDGELKPFKPGVERILEESKVPVIPIALLGLWGSFFSRKGGKAMSKMPRPKRRTITIKVGEPLDATANAQSIKGVIEKMLSRFYPPH